MDTITIRFQQTVATALGLSKPNISHPHTLFLIKSVLPGIM